MWTLDRASLAAVRLRTKVWPRFLMYILVFLSSQGPGVIWSLLGNPNWPWGVQIFIGVISNLNGFLNALVYGLTNVQIYRHWMSFVPFRRHEEQDLDSPALGDPRGDRFLDADADDAPPRGPLHSMSTASPAWSIGSAVTWDQR